MTEWRSVVGYEDSYEVSDDGRVRSLDRKVRAHRAIGTERYLGYRLIRGQELRTKPRPNGTGYPQVTLSRDGKLKQYSVHVLMLEAFVGPRPPGMWGLHRDDSYINNVLPNLYWGTPSQNNRDCVRNGNHHLAKKTVCSRGHCEWRVRPTGFRYCGACDREDQRERKRRRG
jgi:hypothetical protein